MTGGPVLFIGGSGRCGSTLLESLLARLPEVCVLGEVVHLWKRGVTDNQLCACGSHFHDCPFWGAVGDRAFGGWDRVDVPEILGLQAQVDRQRHMWRTAQRRPPATTLRQARSYADLYHCIYEAAREVSGARVVVDSSKHAATALALTHHPDLDLRVLQIVRDPRGVAYSWSRAVERPETADRQLMPQLDATTSTVYWLSHNLALGAVSYRRRPLARLRYEDLVREPQAAVAQAWRQLDLPGPGLLPMVAEQTIELRPTHSVAGNPMRFRTGPTTLRTDEAWRTQMPARDRRVVTALGYPALRLFGYEGGRRG